LRRKALCRARRRSRSNAARRSSSVSARLSCWVGCAAKPGAAAPWTTRRVGVPASGRSAIKTESCWGLEERAEFSLCRPTDSRKVCSQQVSRLGAPSANNPRCQGPGSKPLTLYAAPCRRATLPRLSLRARAAALSSGGGGGGPAAWRGAGGARRVASSGAARLAPSPRPCTCAAFADQGAVALGEAKVGH